MTETIDVGAPPRMIAVWCPDWPVVAASQATGLSDGTPAAVFTANRVVACSHAARSNGVRRGQRRREAQARCAELVVFTRDVVVEARAFEPIVAQLESIAPGVEITRPGLAMIGARGPTRYFGGEDGVLATLSRAVSGLVADLLVGIADGAFAAEQAARQGLIVPGGQSPEFLADLPISTLDPAGQGTLIELLNRLGIRTLGAFAALAARDVLARFGPDGAWAHRQAGGRDDRPLAARRVPTEFSVGVQLDAPIDRVDTMAFTASGTVERFVTDLAAHGLACTCFELRLRTDREQETSRRWRHTGVLTSTDILDRLRWQLEGWRAGSQQPTGGIVELQLIPVETVPTGAHQQGLWGGSGAHDERAHRALARVQTRLGPGTVFVPMAQGGRAAGQRIQLVPWGDDPMPHRAPEPPWPGRLSAPAPSVLFDPPPPIQVLDENGSPVRVTPSGVVPRPPSRLLLSNRAPVPTAAWAGPWPLDESWWDPETATRVALLQLVDVHGRAYLVSCRLDADQTRWSLEGVYD